MNIDFYLKRKSYLNITKLGVNYKTTEYQKEVAKLAFVWCSYKMGKSKYHLDLPTLKIFNIKCKEYRGHYDEVKNEIVIYLKNHRSSIDICRTIIHEWKHYQQNILIMYDVYLRVYNRKLKNHPYEISAEKTAIRLGGECKNWVIAILKQKNNG
jgi:hypothetical protein